MKYQIINTYAAATATEKEKSKMSASKQVYRELLRYNESRCAADVQIKAESKSERKSA